jgi:hypothetical protein
MRRSVPSTISSVRGEGGSRLDALLDQAADVGNPDLANIERD